MSLKCFYCNNSININDLYELKYIFPKLRGNLFLINVCQLCSDTICVYRNLSRQNEFHYEYMKINNNMEKIKIHNYLGSISGINIFKDELGSTPFKNISLNEEINIKGKIYDGNNDPIIDAMIETWQCDENGKYYNYQGFSRRVTDFKTGEYQLKTIRPGNQINEDGTISPSYILFWIVARGMNRPLITRMYFDENEIKSDVMFKNLSIQDRLKTLIPYTEDKKNFVFDIHLQGKKETIFFEF